MRFTSSAFAGCLCCCSSHAGQQPGAVLQHATQQHRQSRNLSRKNVHIFQLKLPKLPARRSTRASSTRFPSCHIYQLRLWLKFGILEAWSWSAGCPRLATVGARRRRPQLRKWRSLYQGTARHSLSTKARHRQQPGTTSSIGRSIIIRCERIVF